ncbi:hypothetical protein ACIGXM_12905 [Kitasatospora sp. NPDC052896]
MPIPRTMTITCDRLPGGDCAQAPAIQVIGPPLHPEPYGAANHLP